MTQARRNSKRKRGKAGLAMGAAGVSLAMTGAASATATNVPSQDNARQFILGEEEISDVSLATFHIFDRENPSLSQDIKEARGGCGRCGGGGRCAGGGGRCAGAGGGRCAGGCAVGGRCAGGGRCAVGRCAVGRCAVGRCAVGIGRACLGCAVGCSGTCTQWDPNLGQWVNVCY
jgi:hypothetical protein